MPLGLKLLQSYREQIPCKVWDGKTMADMQGLTSFYKQTDTDKDNIAL